MRTKSVGYLPCCLLCLGSFASRCNAQVDAAVFALTGTQIIKQGDAAIQNRIYQADQVANGLVNKLTTNASVLVEGAKLNLKDVMDRPLKQMDESQRAVFLAINEINKQIAAATGTAYKMEEIVNIDVADRCGSQVPFCKSVVFTSSIQGLAVLRWLPTHTLTIVGTGLGPGQSDRTAEVKFFYRGKQLVPQNIDLSKHNEGRYIFDTKQFSGLFWDDKPRTLDLVAQLVVRNSGWFSRSAERYVNTHLLLTLYPLVAGKATFSYKKPVYGWVFKETRTQPFRARDCGAHQCGDGGQREDVQTTPVAYSSTPVLGSQMVANPRLPTCGAPAWDLEGCRYNYNRSATIASPPDHVNAGWQQTGVWLTMYVTFDVLEWGVTIQDGTPEHVELRYDRLADFCVPQGVTYYVLEGVTITNEPFQVVTGQPVPDFLQFNGKFASACPGNGDRYSYSVLKPKG